LNSRTCLSRQRVMTHIPSKTSLRRNSLIMEFETVYDHVPISRRIPRLTMPLPIIKDNASLWLSISVPSIDSRKKFTRLKERLCLSQDSWNNRSRRVIGDTDLLGGWRQCRFCLVKMIEESSQRPEPLKLIQLCFSNLARRRRRSQLPIVCTILYISVDIHNIASIFAIYKLPITTLNHDCLEKLTANQKQLF